MEKLNKKGQTRSVFKSTVFAVLIFSMIIVAFVAVPAERYGFFEQNNFVEPENDLLELDKTNNISQAIKTIGCDINPDSKEAASCEKEPDVSLLEQAQNALRNMVVGGFGALVTITKTLGTIQVLIEQGGLILGIPVFITQAFVSMVFLTVLISAMLLLFTRSGEL